MRPSLLAVAVLFLLVFAQTFVYYNQLPPTVASHFDGSGRADTFQSKTAFFVFYWLIAVITAGTFLLTPLLLHRLPVSAINLPNKEFWLAPPYREETLTYLSRHMEWFAAGTFMLLLIVMQVVIIKNLQASAVLPTQITWLILGGYVAFTLLWMMHLYRRFKKPES